MKVHELLAALKDSKLEDEITVCVMAHDKNYVGCFEINKVDTDCYPVLLHIVIT